MDGNSCEWIVTDQNRCKRDSRKTVSFLLAGDGFPVPLVAKTAKTPLRANPFGPQGLFGGRGGTRRRVMSTVLVLIVWQGPAFIRFWSTTGRRGVQKMLLQALQKARAIRPFVPCFRISVSRLFLSTKKRRPDSIVTVWPFVLVCNSEVVQVGLEPILGGQAGIHQEAFLVFPFFESPVVEQL